MRVQLANDHEGQSKVEEQKTRNPSNPQLDRYDWHLPTVNPYSAFTHYVQILVLQEEKVIIENHHCLARSSYLMKSIQ